MDGASRDVSRGFLGKDGKKYHKHYKAVKLSVAKEIVKQEAPEMDNVCLWKFDKKDASYPYMTSCGFYFEDYPKKDPDFEYCPGCGKKIKVEEV